MNFRRALANGLRRLSAKRSTEADARAHANEMTRNAHYSWAKDAWTEAYDEAMAVVIADRKADSARWQWYGRRYGLNSGELWKIRLGTVDA